MLCDFDYISVRENSAVKVVEDMGYKAGQVLDPTMVVKKNVWEQMADKGEMKVRKPYVLVYNLHADSNMLHFVKEEAKRKGLAVYSITTTFRKIAGRNIFCLSIEGFLWMFKNAECIYTDSFHAIAFSLIFNKNLRRCALLVDKGSGQRAGRAARGAGFVKCFFENI